MAGGNSYVCSLELAEVPLQQALESLAVAGLIASHLVDSVMDLSLIHI